jgi:hypothetical protein
MRPAKILTAMILMMSVPACDSGDPAPAAPPPATSPTALAPSGAPASSATAEAVAACRLAAQAPGTGEAIEIDEQMVRTVIDDAAKSGVDSIEQAGAQVQTKYSAWLNADAGDEAASALDDVLDAVGRVHNACVDAAVTTP